MTSSTSGYHWGIEVDGDLVGAISVVNLDGHDAKAEVGDVVARRAWGRGLATEALTAVVAHMFEEVGLNRLYAVHAPGNTASGRVLVKAGFEHEGLAIDHMRCTEGFQDCHLYGLTRGQWRRRADEAAGG